MELAQRVEQLYQDLYDAVYRYLMLTGSNPVDANEYTQEAFLRLFKSLKAGQNIEKPRNWLISVAHNARLHEARKESRNARLFETQFDLTDLQIDPSLSPEAALLEQQRLDRVRSAMSRLTQRQSEYLNLRAEGLKLREIADLYGVAVQAVADACARAIERLGKLTHE